MTNKDKDYQEEHEVIRKKLWINIYISYVSSSNSVHVEGGALWADTALFEFDKRFKNPITKNPNENK